MRLWLLSNTKFGYKNNNQEWLNNMFNYFETIYIPFINKNVKEGDILIHLGNLFDNPEHINTETFNRTQKIFENISSILPIYFLVGKNDISNNNIDINSINIFKNFKNINIITEPTEIGNILLLPWLKFPIGIINESSKDYIIFNLDSSTIKELIKKDKNIYCGFNLDKSVNDNITNIGSPYQFEKTSSDKGFFVVDVDKNKSIFVENKFNPKYKTITITSEEQLKDLDRDDIEKNYVNVVIDQELINDKKIKIDILLSQYDFKNITYINGETKEMEIVNNNDINIISICRENITDESTLKEFDNIVSIYKEKY